MLINNSPLYKLFRFLSKARKRQLYFLFFLLIINGFLESFSIATIIPFISLIASPGQINNIPFFSNIFYFFGLRDIAESLLLITVLFCIFIFLSTFMRIFNMYCIYKISAKIEIDFSNLIFKNNIYQSYSKYTTRNSSDIITIVIDKVSAAVGAMSALLIVLAGTILGLFMIISLFFIDWRFLIIGLIFLFISYSLIYSRVRKTLYTSGKRLAEKTPYRIRILQEVFFGFRDLIINQNEQLYRELFKGSDSEIKLIRAKASFLQSFPRYLIEGLIVLILVIICYYLSFIEFNLAVFIPTFAGYIYVFQRLLPLLNQIYGALASYKVKAASINDVIEELENNKINYKKTDRKSNLNFCKELVLKDIYFAYENSDLILENINLHIKKGEHIGIYGDTGGGKSTLLDLIMGLIRPTKGDLYIDDFNIYKNNENQNWICNIAHVSQNIFLKEGSIAENIAFGESIENINYNILRKVSKTACIYDFISQTKDGFETQVGERGIRLSGGQRQRIAIARALYKSREILVLDEATSALDENTEKRIMESIKKLKITIIMVTHRPKSLKICDKIIKLYDKKIFIE